MTPSVPALEAPPRARPAHGSAYAALKDANSSLLREDVERRSVVFRGRPEVVMLNHTDICNLRCVMCPRHLAPGRTRLPRDVLELLTRRLFPTARKAGLAAAQAEPLASDFEFLVDAALRHGVELDVVTNGTLLTPERYRHARAAIDLLDVSVDCHVPEIYRRIRLGARFATVHANLRAIHEERRRAPDDVLFTISAVVMKSNLLHLPGLVRFARGLDAAAVVFKRLNHDVKATPEEDPVRHHGIDVVRAALQECARVARDVGINLVRSDCGVHFDELPMQPVLVRPCRLPRGSQITGKGLCWYLAQNFHVMQTGEVYPCIVPTPHSVGNVKHEDPLDIWNGPGLRRLRAAHFGRRRVAVCSGCKLAPHLPPAARVPRAVPSAARHGHSSAARAPR